MVQETERPIFLTFVSCFGPELFVTPACLAQVQNRSCSSGGTRCFTLHRGWRIDLPTSMLSGCAFFSVSSNSSKISLEQQGKSRSEITYSRKLLHNTALRESATGLNPRTQRHGLWQRKVSYLAFLSKAPWIPKHSFSFITMTKIAGKPRRTVTREKVSPG